MPTHCNQPLLHVPLILRLPARVPSAKRIADFVSLVDLPATVLDLVGLQPAVPMPGHTLASLWGSRGDPAACSAALTEVSKTISKHPDLPASKGDMVSLFLDGLQLIQNGDGSEELYDVRLDPAAERDLLSARPAAADLLRARLRVLLGDGR